LCKMHGADMMYSEFISSEGLIRDAMKSKKKLDIFDYERPVGIQIFGGDEEAMALSAKIVEAVEPDIVDINFGCPVKKVVCKGAGAGVLKDIDLMIRLTKAVVNSTHLPVTVKTRLGWDTDTINIMEVAERLQETGIKALTIHARTRSQMYKGEADWNYISKVKNNPNIEIPIFGNGDVNTPEKALEYKQKYDCDGIMIGRGAIGYPWIFNEVKHFFETGENLPKPTIAQRLEAVRQHAEWSTEWKGEKLGLIEMRQHYGNYFRGIPHFKDFRVKFLEVFTMEEMAEVIAETESFYEEFRF
jgi:tRNA-dihydrouridine synthase B